MNIDADDRGVVSLDLDLFSDSSLADPFADYRRLRDAGPIVWLARPGVYALARYSDVQKALREPELLVSGEGVGFGDSFNATKGVNLIQTDGDVHRRMRATVMRPLTPSALREARPKLKSLINDRVRELKGAGQFDAMVDLAPLLPVEAVSHLVGLPEDGRERMLDWAAAAFNVIGPDQFPDDVATAREAFDYMSTLRPNRIREGSWAATLFAAAGRLTQAEAIAAVSAYVIPSLDTTILATGLLLHNLAVHPDQWATLRKQPERIPAAVLEGVRHSSVLRWFARVAAQDYSIGALTIPQGARVMLLYGSANRDERQYADPDVFDITRDARAHLSWGTGPHMCVGMHLARIEMEVLLEALVELGAEVSSGAPVRGTNRGLYGFSSLPFAIH